MEKGYPSEAGDTQDVNEGKTARSSLLDQPKNWFESNSGYFGGPSDIGSD